MRPRLWPRLVRYHWHRLLKLPGTAHSVALGTALGVGVSFTPILGGRLLVSVGLAALFRANPFAAAAGSHFGNPLVYPLIFVGAVLLGGALTGREVSDAISLDGLADLILPALVGLTLAGGLTSLAVYVLVLKGVRAYQEKRRARFARARAR